MTKFAKFDRATLKTLRAEMQEVMNKYSVKANLEIEVGNMSFSDAEVTIKVNAKVKGAETISSTILKQVVDNEGLCLKNLKGDELVEYKPRSYKMPFVFKCGDTGKLFKTDLANARRRFGPMMAKS